MVEAAEDWKCNDFANFSLTNSSRGGSWNALTQALMRTRCVEVALDVLLENTPQVSLTQDYNMVEALSAH